jgi:Uma2 family endonuclease
MKSNAPLLSSGRQPKMKSTDGGPCMSIDISSQPAASAALFATSLDLAERFGDIPLYRIRFTPPPGEATDEDVLAINDHEGRLFELVDGTLVEKAMGSYESLIAGKLITRFNVYLEAHPRVGIALPPDGFLRLRVKLIRIPDVSFIAREQLQKGKFPRRGIATMAPTIAVEVISESNTKREMEGKLDEYFQYGAKEVWYIYPDTKTLLRYTARHEVQTLTGQDTLVTPVLPGFVCPLAPLFAHPDDDDWAAEAGSSS